MSDLSDAAAAVDTTLAALETQLATLLTEAEAARIAAQVVRGNQIVEGDPVAALCWAHVNRIINIRVARGHASATGTTAPAAQTLADIYPA